MTIPHLVGLLVTWVIVALLFSFGDLTENHEKFRNPWIRMLANMLCLALIYILATGLTDIILHGI